MLNQIGISAGWVKRDVTDISEYLFPVVIATKAGSWAVLTQRRDDAYVLHSTENNIEITLDEEEVIAIYGGYALLSNSLPAADMRGEHDTLPAKGKEGHWLYGTLWRYRHYFYSAALAALLANILTLATTFFTMNVYDRVVPNQAYATLWSMAIGVSFAIIFEFISRQVRAWLIDVAGKKADLVLGAWLFRHIMSIRLEYKPHSAGSFANQMREFESVRDFLTSATLSTLSDIPFCLLFLLIIYLVGGPLAWIPLGAVPIIILVSLLIQRPLAKNMQENMREASLKHGILIETIEGLHALKAARGEGVMQKRWEDYSALSARSGMKTRYLSTLTMNFTTLIQQLTTVIVVVWGVYLIHSGYLTMGSMVGVVILSGRMLSPLAAVVGLALRYQQAKTALTSLNKLTQLPTERDTQRNYLPTPKFEGHIQLKNIYFDYPIPGSQSALSALQGVSCDIKQGERLAVIGNIGSGKSTLLQIIARLYQPKSGQLMIDGIDAFQVDPADWRSAVGYVGQDSRLFYGTLRENVMIGDPSASTSRFLEVAKLTGLDAIAAKHPMGFDMPVGERGQLLSGGQQQLVALARCLMLEPKILLLDEPTSSMDVLTEARFMAQLNQAITHQTLIIVTHRFSLLQLVNRLIVFEEGKIIRDGDKDAVLAQTRAGSSTEK